MRCGWICTGCISLDSANAISKLGSCNMSLFALVNWTANELNHNIIFFTLIRNDNGWPYNLLSVCRGLQHNHKIIRHQLIIEQNFALSCCGPGGGPSPDCSCTGELLLICVVFYLVVTSEVPGN